jgi:hypothetical protein
LGVQCIVRPGQAAGALPDQGNAPPMPIGSLVSH